MCVCVWLCVCGGGGCCGCDCYFDYGQAPRYVVGVWMWMCGFCRVVGVLWSSGSADGVCVWLYMSVFWGGGVVCCRCDCYFDPAGRRLGMPWKHVTRGMWLVLVVLVCDVCQDVNSSLTFGHYAHCFAHSRPSHSPHSFTPLSHSFLTLSTIHTKQWC